MSKFCFRVCYTVANADAEAFVWGEIEVVGEIGPEDQLPRASTLIDFIQFGDFRLLEENPEPSAAVFECNDGVH